MRRYFRTLIQDLKAIFRGEKRVAPRSVRGRVYVNRKTNTSVGGPVVHVKSGKKASLKIRITRADGTVEHYDNEATVTNG